jgi:hypothetical protein
MTFFTEIEESDESLAMLIVPTAANVMSGLPLTRLIASLEKELGTKLFERAAFPKELRALCCPMN